MARFKLFLERISCNAITDSLLEGNQDEIYLRVWYQKYNSILIKEEIPLGSFQPGNAIIYDKYILDEYNDLESLGFDFFDSDLFSADDLLGGFILSTPNELRLGPYTTATFDTIISSTIFNFNGNGSNYELILKYEAV